MESLTKILREGLFDHDLATKGDAVAIWCDQHLENMYGNKPEYEIDHTHKKVIFSNEDFSYGWNTFEVFFKNGDKVWFPDYKFVDKKDRGAKLVTLYGDIDKLNGIDKISDSLQSIFFKNGRIDTQVYKDINKYFKKLNQIYFVMDAESKGMLFGDIDLSELTIPVHEIYIADHKPGATITYNTNQKVDIVSFGYNCSNTKIKSLPILKILSFKCGDFECIQNIVNGIEDKGKSDFDKVTISDRGLTVEEKKAIKELLKGDSTSAGGVNEYMKTIKKLDIINKTINTEDATKDRFGEKLQLGDVVLIADSANPQWPSTLDIYKGATTGGRIRTQNRSQLPPRNVIKLNNPKILELLK